MNTKSIKTASLPKATSRVFLAGLLLFASSVLLAGLNEESTEGASDGRDSQLSPNPYAMIWESPDRQLVLLGSSEVDRRTICPRLVSENRQPFCRRFQSPIVEVCGDRNLVVIVLGNGDIHRVNSALIGRNGDFEPEHRSSGPASLVKAWFPGDSCNTSERLPVVLAIESSGQIWHFDSLRWSTVSTHRVSLQTPATTRIHPTENGSN